MKTYISYYRVSTQKQGISGLGLEAQRAVVAGFLKAHDIVSNEYVEIESGKKNNRPKLAAAIAEAKATGATLIIAKLDRLARNVAFIATLMETGVDFLACDNPTATPFTLHIFAAMAEQEAKLISERTKAALAAKKARGETLGHVANLTQEGRAKGREAVSINAQTNKQNIQVASIIQDKLAQQWTLRKIATHLNQLEYKTRRGKEFSATQVLRLGKFTPQLST